MLKSEVRILITGGGSGGHLSVAKALIDSLIDDYNIPTSNIIYVGSDLGMEGEKFGNSLEQRQFKDIGVKKFFIRGGKLQRKISFTTLTLLLRSLLGFWDSLSVLRKSNPHVVISTGGFVSVPVCIVSKLFGKPIYLHEQTATVGLSNKIVGKFAKKIYVSFNSSIKYFKKEKTSHVGNTVRKEVYKKDINDKIDEDILNLIENNPFLPFIYISGGSLGSHVINEKVMECIQTLLPSYRVLLQTGDNKTLKDYDKGILLKNSLQEEYKERFVVKKYIDKDNIGYVFNNMNIFLGRAGANTVYEIGVLKKPALFIPIPWVTHNEQYLNAKVLADIGLANILEEKNLKDCNIKNEIEKLRENLKVRKIDKEKLEKLFPTNAISNILEDIFSDIKK